jgi:hypothetical protein
MKKDITTKSQIYDYRPYIDVDISEETENMQKLMEDCKQKLMEDCKQKIYEITGIPKNIFNKEL